MKRFLAGIIILSLVGIIGCAKPQNHGDNIVVTIGAMPDVESVPFIIALKNGYFEEENVQVKIEQFKSAQDRDSALQSGVLDGVVTDILAVAFANEGGIDLRIIAKSDGNINLVSGASSGIKTINELTDRSVGLSTNTVMDYTLDKMLEAKHVNPKDIQKIAIPPLPTRLEMLQAEKIDAAILPEPFAGIAINDGANVLMNTNEMGYKAGVIAFTAQSLIDNPDQIKSVFKAYNKAVEYLANNPREDYIDYIIEKQGFPSEVKQFIVLPQYSNAEPPEEKVVLDVVEWLIDKNLIKTPFNYQTLVDEKVLR